ncbi:hypothetical protein [Desulfosarcina sp.]|uniref:hypothetical protein n=1 Tax=Desulfosarcina sp. TaxID=2027861 RepID=UPI003564FD1B
MAKFRIGGALKATPLLIVLLAMLLSPILRAEATIIRDLRFGDNNGYVRMVLEFDRPLNPSPSFSIHRNTLQVTMTGITAELPDRDTGEYHADIISLEVSQTSDDTRVHAVFSFDPADVKTFWLTGPPRFIIDAYRPLSPAAAQPPGEASRQMEMIEETVTLPDPTSEPATPQPDSGSTAIDEASTEPNGAAIPVSGIADDFHRNRFQQRLIAALIVVTSIIVLLLIFLLYMGAGRKNPPEPSWVYDLPSTKDRDIESIDAVIGEHLKNQDHR